VLLYLVTKFFINSSVVCNIMFCFCDELLVCFAITVYLR